MLVVTELSNRDSFALRGAMMQRIEDAQAEVVDLGVIAIDTGVKHTCFHFIMMAFIYTVHQALMEKRIATVLNIGPSQ